jgi:DNA-binding response OmpR family regulator
MEICRRLRAADSAVPILLLTARTDETDKVLGLELGADDYLTKPFSIREVLARVRSILRRVQMSRSAEDRSTMEPLQSGDLELDVVKRQVRMRGEILEMTAKEFDLLHVFMADPGRAFSRQQLLEQVWGYVQGGYEHTLNTHINRLRGKIEPDPGSPSYIITVWGVGYRIYILQHHQGPDGLEALCLKRAVGEVVRETVHKWGAGWGRTDDHPRPNIFGWIQIATSRVFLPTRVLRPSASTLSMRGVARRS